MKWRESKIIWCHGNQKKRKKEEVISKEEYVNSEFPHCYVKYEYK